MKMVKPQVVRKDLAIERLEEAKPMGTGQGLYFMGTAAELEPDKVEWAIHTTSARAGKVINRTAADYLNESCRRFYQFTPNEVWVTGSRIPVENQLVDTKIRLNLEELRG